MTWDMTFFGSVGVGRYVHRDGDDGLCECESSLYKNKQYGF